MLGRQAHRHSSTESNIDRHAGRQANLGTEEGGTGRHHAPAAHTPTRCLCPSPDRESPGCLGPWGGGGVRENVDLLCQPGQQVVCLAVCTDCTVQARSGSRRPVTPWTNVRAHCAEVAPVLKGSLTGGGRSRVVCLASASAKSVSATTTINVIAYQPSLCPAGGSLDPQLYRSAALSNVLDYPCAVLHPQILPS